MDDTSINRVVARGDTCLLYTSTGSELGLFVAKTVGDADGSHQTPQYGSFYRDDKGEISLRRPPPGETVVARAPMRAIPSAPAAGGNYALVIGISNYAGLPKLRTPVSDAQAIAQLLRENYGFQTSLLLDATRAGILEALLGYRRSLGPNDNLLIYYAGHGYYDRETSQAFWLPTDAGSVDSPNRIIADEITANIRVQPARHVLLIADGSYSGAMASGTRGGERGPGPDYGDRQAYLARLMSNRSRTLLASGGDEPVMGGGPSGHSIFTNAVLRGLTEEKEPIFSAEELFEMIRIRVGADSNQLPVYAHIRNSNDDSGDFIFVKTKP